MAIEYEAGSRIGLLCLLVFSVVVKGGFWRQNWTNKSGRWVSQAEGPIFYVMMVLLFGALGVVLTLEAFGVL